MSLPSIQVKTNPSPFETDKTHSIPSKVICFFKEGIELFRQSLEKEADLFTRQFSKKSSFKCLSEPVIGCINRLFKTAVPNSPKPSLSMQPLLQDAKLPRSGIIENQEVQKIAVYNNSLFRTLEPANANPINSQVLSILAGGQDECDPLILLEYLENHPQCASGLSTLHAIKKGLLREKALNKIIEEGKSKDPEQADKELEELSNILQSETLALKSGESLFQPFTIKKESLIGHTALSRVIDKLKKI